jgi:hypothetical protein
MKIKMGKFAELEVPVESVLGRELSLGESVYYVEGAVPTRHIPVRTKEA